MPDVVINEGSIPKGFIETIKILDLVVGCLQPELKELDSHNPLLKYEVINILGGVGYSPTFKKRFGGTPLSKEALQNYRSTLETEIEKLKAKRN